MAFLFLVVLVVAWAGIALPAATRARRKGPLESTARFKQGLELIGPAHHSEFVRTLGRVPAPYVPVDRTVATVTRPQAAPSQAPRPVEVPAAGGDEVAQIQRPVRVVRPAPAPSLSSLRIDRERTLVLAVLAGAAVISLALALLQGMWELHLAADSFLAIYVSWLLEEKHRRSQRARKVRSLQTVRRRMTPEPLRAAAGER